MNTLLLDCLNTHSTTIIPEFGAIMKLGNSYVFNEFLKFDDGKFTNFVAQKKKCSIDEVKDLIKNWTKEIIATINNNNTYLIDNIGVLAIENGKTVLKKNDVITQTISDSKPNNSTAIIADNENQTQTDAQSNTENNTQINESKETQNADFKIHKKAVETNDHKTQLPDDSDLSTSLSAKMAIASIDAFREKNALIEFTRGENRKTVIEALNKKLTLLNNITDAPPTTQSTINETSKEEDENSKQIIDLQVNDSIDSSIIAKPNNEEDQDIEALISLTQNIDNLENSAANNIPVSKDVITSKTNEAETLKKEEIIKEKVSTAAAQDEKALEIIAQGVSKLNKEQRKRKRKRIILFAALLCLMTGGGIMGFLHKDYLLSLINDENNESTVTTTKKTKKEVADNNITDTVATALNYENQLPEQNADQEPATEQLEKPIEINSKPIEKTIEVKNAKAGINEGSFTVIGGSFSKDENAKNLVEKLKAEGFSDAKTQAGSGSLTKVVVGTYNTKDEAKNVIEQLSSKGMKGILQTK